MAELPGATDGESMYVQPVSVYDVAANDAESTEDEASEAAEMAASFGALGFGETSSGWVADSYAVPDGFAEYAEHAQQAAMRSAPSVPSTGPSLAAETIYSDVSEGVPPQASAKAKAGWAKDAYAIPEGYDEYVQSIATQSGQPVGAGQDATSEGLLPTNFSPAPAPAPILASIDAVTAEESSLLPTFAPAAISIQQSTGDLLAGAPGGGAAASMIGVGGGLQISPDIFADDQGDTEGEGPEQQTDGDSGQAEPVVQDAGAAEAVADANKDA